MSTLPMDERATLNMEGRLRESATGGPGADYSPESSDIPTSEYLGLDNLSIAIIGPNEALREELSRVFSRSAGNKVREFSSYPPSLDYLAKFLEQNHDVLVVELDSDPEYALDLVEGIGAQGSLTVMVYSGDTDPDMLVRCMRAGAREFLTLPLQTGVVEEALVRAAARRPAPKRVKGKSKKKKKTSGRLLGFMGSKGGTGVTTLACGFAVALAQDSRETTVLIDLDLPLGDAGLNLGITSEHSTITALQAADRLDASLLSRFLMKHESGLSVLPAPGKLQKFHASNGAIEKLLTVARQEFDNVVVDFGSKFDMNGANFFKDPCTAYLVTQTGIPELRNAHRIISHSFGLEGPNLEIIINRYEGRAQGVTDEYLSKALTRPAQWKIPNDYASVKKMQVEADPLGITSSPVSLEIRRMAQAVTGTPASEVEQPPAKKKAFCFFW